MARAWLYFWIVVTMFLWGINVTGVKLLTMHFAPLTMTAVRISIAAIATYSIVIGLKHWQRPAKAEWKWLILASFLGVVLHHILLSQGIASTTATKSSIIVGFSPLLTMLFTLLAGTTSFDSKRFFGFILGLLGVILAVSLGEKGITAITIGDVYVFLSIASQALSFLVIRKLASSINAFALTAYMLGLGAVALVFLSVVLEPVAWQAFASATWWHYAILLASGIGATAIGQTIYNYAIGQLGAAETSIFTNFSTIFALIGSAVILQERIVAVQWLGCLLIVVGVVIGSGVIHTKKPVLK